MTESHKNPNKKKLPFSGTKKGSFFESAQTSFITMFLKGHTTALKMLQKLFQICAIIGDRFQICAKSIGNFAIEMVPNMFYNCGS